MKKNLLPAALLIILGAHFNSAEAQEYQPVSIQSGFNADVIANGIGPSALSTNHDVDGVNFAFLSRDFQLTSTSTPISYGLPVNKTVNTMVSSTPGLSYLLAPYSSNNSLRLQNSGSTGTLTFSTPTPAVSLYMLATSGSGSSTVNAVINFSEGSSEAFTGINISDWYNAAGFAIQGIGRINISNDNLESGGGTDPRLYQIPITISLANQSKNIESVTVTKTGSGGIPNIFAVSADVYTACASPADITYTSAMTGVAVSWTSPASAPSNGYEYYYTTSSAAPTSSTTPTGSVAAGVTSVVLNGLITGQTYNFWVRSNCGTSSKGFWKMKQITAGQIFQIYSAGDIHTLYNTAPTTTSVNTCPGTLSISIPAGYKIKSTDVSYVIGTGSNGWMSEQRSLLTCLTNNTPEASVSAGSGSNSGSYSYSRTGLTIANNLTGTVDFELKGWRTYGGSGCTTEHNKINNNTWKVTVTLEAITLGIHETSAAKEIWAYPNPFGDILNIGKSENVKRATLTDFSGITVKTIENPGLALHLGDVKAGAYILTLTMKDGSVKSTKIIKK